MTAVVGSRSAARPGQRPARGRARLLLQSSILSLCLGTLLSSTGSLAGDPQTALLAGVRAFRAEHYDEALQTFRAIADQRSVPEIGFYLGTTLHKLGRHGEALVAFRAARRAGLRETIVDYYEAVSCYRLGMFERARHGFSVLLQAPEDQVGPRLREGATRFLRALNDAPSPQSRYELAQSGAATASSESTEWLEEALRLWRRLPHDAQRDAVLQRLIGRLPPEDRGELAPLWRCPAAGGLACLTP